MAQGWTINVVTGKITFLEAPPTGVDNIEVKEFAAGARGGTDVWAVGAWSYRYGFPGEVEFYGDRMWFAGSPGDPQTVWASNIGDYNNYGRSSPIVDSDAVSFTINARQVNAIRDLVPLDNLLVLTTGGEWKVTGGQDDVVTPSTIGIKPQSYYGVGKVPARALGESAILLQEQGQKVRDLSYQFEKDGFRGNEISIWADHLIEGHTFSGIEKTSAPWQTVWMVRDDGVLVGCTYMPEQEVSGWHRHDTGRDAQNPDIGVDRVLDVCCLPRKDETQTYALVRRVVDGQVRQYIEQKAPTRQPETLDWKYLDSMLTYDGRNASITTITLTGAGWTENNELTATASDAVFTGASDVGDGLLLQLGKDKVRCIITGFTSTTVVTVRSIGSVPAALRGAAVLQWTLQRDNIGGLGHLEGRTVFALVDGHVERDLVVSVGKVQLQRPGGVVQVGLPYGAHIETLEINSSSGEAVRVMNKLGFDIALQVRGTRGVHVGSSLENLDPIAQRQFEDYDDPTAAHTGIFKKNITAKWGEDCGHFHIFSDDPLPMEILAIIPKVAISD